MFARKPVHLALLISMLALLFGEFGQSVAQTSLVPMDVWLLQGRVYEGDVGDESTPLQNVTVAVYGAYAPYPNAGTFIRSATTNVDGWYGVEVYDDDGAYDYYYILETDPGGYNSIGATTVSGTVRTANWIEYAAPLTGQTLTGNKFWDQPETPTWTLQGRVYQGTVGDESTPIEGVTVSLYGAGNPYPDSGTFITSTTTNSAGWYGLEAPSGYEYYHIQETDPGGYTSIDATTVNGTVRTANWIEYNVPLAGQTLTGNKFWDQPTVTEPDLIVTDVWNEGADICYQIENAGSGPAAGGHSTALHIDSIQVTSQTVGAELAPGERWAGCFSYAWACSPPEDHLVVQADHTGVLAESNESNNLKEELWSCDIMPPEITAGPEAMNVDETSALIWWTTNEPSDSVVRYDEAAGSLDLAASSATLVITHEIPLTGLDPSTTYHFVVQSTDAYTNTVESRDRLFKTHPVPDTVDPTVSLNNPGLWQGEITLEAEASDDTGVSKVEFMLDGVLLLTDYSSPYMLHLDTSLYANGEHVLAARVVDQVGRSSQDDLMAPFDNLQTPDAPIVNIISPSDGAVVSGNPITITANVTDDGGLVGVSFFVYSGTQYIWSDAVPYSTPYPTQTQVSFAWNTYHEADAEYYISVQAVDDAANFTTAHLNLTLNNVVPPTPPQYPWLVVTKHTATRVQNYFQVEIEVKNTGNATASDIQIVDGLWGFQAISTTSSLADYSADYNPVGGFGLMRIRSKFNILPGGKRTYTFNVVPVMVYPNPPTPSIGSFIDINWKSPSQQTYYSYKQLPIAKTTGGETIPQAHANAAKAADYLLVTDSYRLFLQYAPTYYSGPSASTAQVNSLLSSMAELARYRNGVLGFYGSYSATALKNLLQPTGAWGQKLGSNFTSGGYLLIVGETEIVGTFISTGWSWKDGIVEFTDQPFGNTAGDKAPEIAVSRIVGNSSTQLRDAIENSLGVIKGTTGYGFDRSHALVISGTGDGQDNFVDNTNDIGGILSGKGISVSKLHWKDYASGSRLSQFLLLAPNRDVIFFRDHGNVDTWEGSLNTWDFPVNFGSTNPFAYASACLAGNYEDHRTYHGGDYNIVEAFFDSGAAVYLGSTELSPRSTNSDVGKKFFTSWAGNTSASVGKTLVAIEQAIWDTGDKYDLWVYEYNLYGDPKFGATTSSPDTSAGDVDVLASYALTAPTSIITITVPDYEVNSVGELDYVQIPDGLWWAEEGMPEVPIYPVWVEVPNGYKVQEVFLIHRDGLSETIGLNLPLASMEPDCGREGSWFPATADEAEEWVPGKDFDWTAVEQADGSSTLRIMLYPFLYNRLTTEVAFFQDYTFEVISTPSSVEITNLEVGSDTYAPGDVVTVDIGLQNDGEVQDVTVSALISHHGSGTAVAGLLLRTLDEMTGTASFSPQWNSTGAAAGLYDVEVTLRDPSGNLLDRTSQMFQLGVSSGEVVALTATPEVFNIGDAVSITMVFSNTGTTALTGTAIVRVQDEGGATIQEFSDVINGLALGESLTVNHVWDTTGEASGTYGIVGYATYEGMSADPLTTVVTTQRKVYLPLVLKGQ